jgi:hypothetical protein
VAVPPAAFCSFMGYYLTDCKGWVPHPGSNTKEGNFSLCEGVGPKQSLIIDHKPEVKTGMHSGPSAVQHALSPSLS